MSKRFNIVDPHPVMHLLEVNTAKGLGQDVCVLLVGPDELHDHRSLLDAITYEVVAEINVLVEVVKYQIVAELDRKLIVDYGITWVMSLFGISRRSRAIQIPCHAIVPAVMYSALHEELVTIFCFSDCQVIGLLPRGKTRSRCFSWSPRRRCGQSRCS